ncbi:hypothetical protein [Bryobacter aggregatus]|uniref:hypothetical protein n=1 Tax=Bryobacter aggregatus TaxID=360054 RepID=UPI0004E24484|nr:hypothetical protein [Bryobacter aggregatus]
METKQQSKANPASDGDPSHTSLEARLRADCQPASHLEEEAFQRYAWATYQATQSRKIEQLTEERWQSDPDNPILFSQMERTQKMAAAQERRADRALKALCQLQKDRFAAYEVTAELALMGSDIEIPKTMPAAELRNTNLHRTNPNYLAQFLLYDSQDLRNPPNSPSSS